MWPLPLTHARAHAAPRAPARAQTPQAWFSQAGLFTSGKALDACGTNIPSAWNPACDETLGERTQGCECAGIKKADGITVKSIDPNKDVNAERNAGNHAAFAANNKMYNAYMKAQSAQDYENKWMYFGGADGAYSIFPGMC